MNYYFLRASLRSTVYALRFTLNGLRVWTMQLKDMAGGGEEEDEAGEGAGAS